MKRFMLDDRVGTSWTDWLRAKDDRALGPAPLLDKGFDLLVRPPWSWPDAGHGGLDMPQNRHKHQVSERTDHLPEWKRVFEELAEEAEDRYPDGRFRLRRRPKIEDRCSRP